MPAVGVVEDGRGRIEFLQQIAASARHERTTIQQVADVRAAHAPGSTEGGGRGSRVDSYA